MFSKNNTLKLLKKKYLIYSLLFFSIATFFLFGLYHLGKFETVDEHFWKYDRIPRYWFDGILKHNAIKTYINDKPGITTAIVSGFGLPFIQNPQEHRIRDAKITEDDNYTIYDSSQTERINVALRLPLLIANTIFLVYLFWIIKKLSQSNFIAITAIIFIALSPILIGISQIINPDTFLWSCGAGALFTYWVFLKENQKKYLVLTIGFTGAAILAKYTGTILFLLFPLSLFVYLSFLEEKLKTNNSFPKIIKRQIFWFIIILAGTIAFYALGMPAVFVKIKYLYRGTIWSPAFKSLAIPVAALIAIFFADAQFFKSKIILFLTTLFRRHFNILLKIISITAVLFIIFLFANSWFGQKFIPLDNIKENAYFEKELAFPMFDNDLPLVKFFKKIAVEAYPLLFSISPASLFFIIFLLVKIIIAKEIHFKKYIFIILIMLPIFFIGSLLSGVLLNPRYMIILYPFVFLLSAFGCFEFIPVVKNIFKISREFSAGMIIFILFSSGLFSLWTIKPFYFNYMSDLLPKNQLITDSWGYGSYEAAQYLNSLPDAENISIWADRSAICQFIKGKCIRDYKIDLLKTVPDYFVFTRRGQIRHQFIWDNPNLAKKANSDYYDETKTKNLWKFSIGGREDNFIRIVKSEE